MPSVHSKTHDKSKVDVIFATFAVIIAAAMIVAGLFLRTKLAEQNDANVELSAKLEELTDENTRLNIEAASAFELGELEDAARNELGMLPPGNEQTVGIEVAKEDKAVILCDGEERGDYLEKWISSIRNIFNIEK